MGSRPRRCRWRGDTGSARTCSPNGTLARHTRRRTAGDGVLIIDAEPDLERAGVVAHVVLVAGIAVHTLNLGGRRAGHAGDIELRIAIRLGPVPPGDERKRPRADAERHGGRQEADEQAKSRATDTLLRHDGLLSPTNRPAGR